MLRHAEYEPTGASVVARARALDGGRTLVESAGVPAALASTSATLSPSYPSTNVASRDPSGDGSLSKSPVGESAMSTSAPVATLARYKAERPLRSLVKKIVVSPTPQAGDPFTARERPKIVRGVPVRSKTPISLVPPRSQ